MCSMKVVRILGFMSYSPRTLFMPQSKDSMELRLLNGRTSSGKTFTIFGSETDPGIIHQAVRDLFDRIQMMSHREFLIRVSYMELYNEEINDLFAVENQKFQIHESLERGVFVAGLREEIVSNAEQVLKLIESGEDLHFETKT
ncbi:kinesin-like protein KIN-7N [Pyrus x bretschneideri]|uniref:kinesin-like protein KIN-7N n=1 Tax=Pyrus x bretschneideri TaxID=225117 RepID=UPI00202E3118|nr:kinesin-like protein KIN-7N [Pyrus x bretschneideri]